MAEIPVVFSMGDPHGIGPEVLLKALGSSSSLLQGPVIVAGDPEYLRRLARDLGIPLDLSRVEFLSPGPYDYPPRWGRVEAEAGHYAWNCLDRALRHCRDNRFRLLVTAPVNKQALHSAGCTFPGQTEMVGSFFPGRDPVMVFLSDLFHVLLVTVHVPLREVPGLIEADALLSKVEVFFETLKRLGVPKPRLALCGLNPHASEGGLFGDEEDRILRPAVRVFNERHGRDALTGPWPPDTLFKQALAGELDGVIALYHDQGLIPLKLVAFESAVNVTMGLPLIRISPDHGTAFEIAGKGIADPRSMCAAIRWGLRLAAADSGTPETASGA